MCDSIFRSLVQCLRQETNHSVEVIKGSRGGAKAYKHPYKRVLPNLQFLVAPKMVSSIMLLVIHHQSQWLTERKTRNQSSTMARNKL